jgi:nitrate reductase assembly molybdenum cofactor insertion protein NarJ
MRAPKRDLVAAQLLREAANWRLLSTLFSRPREGWRRELASAGGETSDLLIESACAAALNEASEGSYHSIFGPGGPAAPREASYRTTLQLGYVLSALEAFYNAFGYSPNAEETPDHVSVETDFVAYLFVKEALARSQESFDEAETAAEARASFLEAHLSYMAEPLHRSLTHSGVRYLETAAAALLARLGSATVETNQKDAAADLVKIEDAALSCE